MHRFIEKHKEFFDLEDGIDMIIEQYKQAKEDLRNGKNYLYHLAKGHEMCQDIFDVHGTKSELHRIDK